ncbi:MAG: hypothetical protein KDB80_16540 [Planctomycetes bacterium]|nr:hypothetical protein [Planctomycetota bacterium]
MKTKRNLLRTLAATVALVTASMTTPLAAQTGGPIGTPNYVPGYSFPYGQGCGSSFMGPIHLTLGTIPDIGTDALFELTNGVPGNPAWLLLGFVPMNTDLTPIGAWGCHLYVNPVVTVAKNITAVGTAEFEYAIPMNTSLIGVHLFAQGVAQDVMANAFGLVLTNGIEMSIGGTP